MLRIGGALMMILALGLLVTAADLAWRDHVPPLLLWTQFLVPIGVLGVGAGFLSVQPATGSVGRRLRQQSRTYKLGSAIAALAWITVIALAFAYAS